MQKFLIIVIALAAALLSGNSHAQGDGPRSQTLLPVGPWVVVPTYIDISSNQNFQQSILINGADIDADILAVTIMKAFAINGRYAQIWLTPLYGTVGGEIDANTQVPGALQAREKSGFSDPVISFKYGLIGMPALGLAEFGKSPQKFQLGAFVSVTPPTGEYDNDNLLNLGAGRWSMKLALPMVIPMGSPQSTFWEIHPGITFYEDNDDPTGGFNKRTQDPLFKVESHLSHNFSPKLWGSLDLAYQKGGATETDGIADNNETDHWGGGISLGYAFNPLISVQGSYGNILAESDDATGEMFRIKLAVLIP